MPGLGDWQARPIEPAARADALATVRERLRAHPDALQRHRLRVRELVLEGLAGKPTEAAYRSLAATAPDAVETARLELAYGQLLLARGRAEAWAHLDRGLHAAAPHLGGREYLRLQGWLARLRHLELPRADDAPVGLDRLLREAAVIERIERRVAPRRRPAATDRADTVG